LQTSHSLSQFHPSQHKATQSPDGDQETSNQVSTTNLGFAKEFHDPKTHLHIQCMGNKNLTGTACCTSIITFTLWLNRPAMMTWSPLLTSSCISSMHTSPTRH
ncbi:hypothetical protein M404DRAFT_972115, partial [Pisolithus tinctorius Marx 270]